MHPRMTIFLLSLIFVVVADLDQQDLGIHSSGSSVKRASLWRSRLVLHSPWWVVWAHPNQPRGPNQNLGFARSYTSVAHQPRAAMSTTPNFQIWTAHTFNDDMTQLTHFLNTDPSVVHAFTVDIHGNIVGDPPGPAPAPPGLPAPPSPTGATC
jgi:hypothetical protein